ncbi:unnamed protein product, partial [Polarella glacialis]
LICLRGHISLKMGRKSRSRSSSDDKDRRKRSRSRKEKGRDRDKDKDRDKEKEKEKEKEKDKDRGRKKDKEKDRDKEKDKDKDRTREKEKDKERQKEKEREKEKEKEKEKRSRSSSSGSSSEKSDDDSGSRGRLIWPMVVGLGSKSFQFLPPMLELVDVTEDLAPLVLESAPVASGTVAAAGAAASSGGFVPGQKMLGLPPPGLAGMLVPSALAARGPVTGAALANAQGKAQVCFNYTGGKCFRADCRFLHLGAGGR